MIKHTNPLLQHVKTTRMWLVVLLLGLIASITVVEYSNPPPDNSTEVVYDISTPDCLTSDLVTIQQPVERGAIVFSTAELIEDSYIYTESTNPICRNESNKNMKSEYVTGLVQGRYIGDNLSYYI